MKSVLDKLSRGFFRLDSTTRPSELASPHLKWWGEHTFELHQVKAWQFGSLLFRLTRGINEWRLEYHRPQYQYDYEQNWHSITDTNFACPQPRKIERYMFKKPMKPFS